MTDQYSNSADRNDCTLLLSEVVDQANIHDLAQPLESGIPCSPNHPGFRMSLLRRHGDMVRSDGTSAANELIVMGGHVGTHIDALCHVSDDGMLYGEHNSEGAQQGGRFSVHGVDTIEPMACRGIILDVAALHGSRTLPGGYGISVADLESAAEQGGVNPTADDVCILRTGWSQYWNDPEAYLGTETGVPGLTVEASQWLAEREIRAVGADNTAVERIPAKQGHALLPVHRFLLVRRGIYLIENLYLEDLAKTSINKFLFILCPLKIRGGTGSPVRPLALTFPEA